MLEGRKGVALALLFALQVEKTGVEFLLSLWRRRTGIKPSPPSGGPSGIAGKRGLRLLDGGRLLKELAACHAYLLPSLRDSVGTTMMEAMLAGYAPIIQIAAGQAKSSPKPAVGKFP